MNLNSNLYTCSNDRICKVSTPKCADCARYKALYTKQANGSYKPADDLGYCSMRGYRNVADLLMCIHEACDCKNFVPINPDDFKQIWLKVNS